MSSLQDPTIVVGVDGTRESLRALRFAVTEAERTGSELVLVNAVHEVVPFAPMWPFLLSETLIDVGHELLADARTVVDDLSRGRVGCRLVTTLGPAVSVLATAAERARLIVLGRRAAGVVERLFTGSTTFGVVARASCPVVSVPPDWVDDRRHGRLVAAVDGSAASSSVLASAFAAAQERSARLDVVHCWRLDPFYDYLVDEASVQEEWNTRTRDRIHRLVEEWAPRYPSVEVSTRLEYDEVADALVRRSHHADVMVVGRHGHGGIGTRVAMTSPGSTTRALLQHARCPVEVVPTSESHATAPDVGEPGAIRHGTTTA
ncbi:universal stress protein [Sanguibacter sp. 25GB23B1]|uniref:universal stress protein n=1 Tax=unclassified Sanguibacter TaxID=2645534 RepID=UPI0032AED5AF